MNLDSYFEKLHAFVADYKKTATNPKFKLEDHIAMLKRAINEFPIITLTGASIGIFIGVLLNFGFAWLIANALMYLGFTASTSWLTGTVLIYMRPFYVVFVKKVYIMIPASIIPTTIGFYFLGVFSTIIG